MSPFQGSMELTGLDPRVALRPRSRTSLTLGYHVSPRWG